MAAMNMPRQSLGRPDFVLLMVTAALTIVGLVAVWSASFAIAVANYGNPQHFIMNQALWCVVGVVLLLCAARTDYKLYRRHALTLMALTLAALIAVLLVGHSVNDARRWIGVGPLSFQPAEFAKLTVTLYLAAWLASKGASLRSFEGGLAPFVVIIAMVAILIMLQPTLGTTLIIVAITVTMFFVAGATMKQMAALGVAGLLAVAFLSLVAGYGIGRLTTFISPDEEDTGANFQTQQALVALGNGGVTGLGLGASRGKFFYIPESHTDGVFAIIGEESGVVGTVVVLFFYVAIMVRGFQVARKCTDEFGSLVATGITTWITVQAIMNIGGITSILPLTGVPLPFLSFGGNALASCLMAMGVLINISRQNQARELERPAGGRIVRRRSRA